MNIYQFVKEQLDARILVEDILGKPKVISGETSKWTSPFREGDNDPSLCCNFSHIKDFGGDFSGDIFNFITLYKNISNQEALDYIIKTYNIVIPPEINSSNGSSMHKISSNKQNELQTSYILKKSSKTSVPILCTFDTIGFFQKPTSEEIASIKNRIANIKPQIYNLEEIEKNIITGHTCIPAGIKSQKEWRDDDSELQVFMVDIDNAIINNNQKENITIDNEKHVTVNKIIDYCKEIDLEPTFIYYTFSHTSNQHKFRLVYILDNTTKKEEEIKGIYNSLKSIFKDYNMDTAPTNISSLFLGGQRIAYKSNIFYKIEKVAIANSIEIIDNNELNACKTCLQHSKYIINNGKLCTLKKDNLIPISNYIVYITEKHNYLNGRDTMTQYVAKCIILDEPTLKLPTQNITTEQYAKFNFVLGSSWDRYAITSAGNTNYDKLREVSQILSRNTMTEKNIYAHTGFIRINDKLCYLYHGGIIGEAENVDVDLSNDNLQNFCFTEKQFDITESLNRSLSILNIAAKKITVPLLAITYLAPLYSILKEENIHCNFLVYIQGKTGSRKSSLAAVLLSHYGNFSADNFPSSFRDTYNSIEKKAYITKDTLNVIDDYNPEANSNLKLNSMDKIYAMYGDRTGRTRMSQNGNSLKSPYYARNLCIVTGETRPDVAQSRIARSIIINITKDSIDLSKLSVLQNNTEQLAFCMMQYIKWIIENQEKIKNIAKNMFQEFRVKQNNDNHGRTNDNINVLSIGFSLFLQFLLDNNIITQERKIELTNLASSALQEIESEQTQEIEELKPSEMFYSAIEQLLATKAISIKDFKSDLPYEEAINGRPAGYFNDSEKYFYFFPDVIFSTVVRFYSEQNIKFPLNKSALWKYLYEEGKLLRNDDKRYVMQRTFGRNKYTVVKIKAPENIAFTTTISPIMPHW